MEQPFYRPTWAEIDLDIIKHNFLQFRKRIPVDVKLMAVVKANGYGHGAVMVAREALEAGADYLGVATLDEAIELRNSGIDEDILILGYTPPEAAVQVVKMNLTQTVFSNEIITALEQEGQKQQRQVKVHLKVDTGMGRLGLRSKEDILDIIKKIHSTSHVQLEGIYTHHACADEAHKDMANLQQNKFSEILEFINSQGIQIPLAHAGNSAVAIDHPEWALNMVRIGVSLYGFYPSTEVNKNAVELKQALSLKTKIAYLKEVERDSTISYGATHRAKGQEVIATLPIGYADGYSRHLSNQARVLVKGLEVPLVGRVCMDQIMINITEIAEDLEVGDEVVLYGPQREGFISIERVAEWIGTINYEVVCMVSRRVPRIYYKNGQVVHTENYLAQKLMPKNNIVKLPYL